MVEEIGLVPVWKCSLAEGCYVALSGTSVGNEA